jgi:hypothetical protein
VEKKLLDGPEQLEDYLDMALAWDNRWDTRPLCAAHAEVGGTYLLELYLGLPFFDFIASVMGFEETVFFFISAEEELLDRYRIRYTEYQLDHIRNLSAGTPFESYNIGCSYSCLSLLGPELWRRYDKPYLAAVAEELHRYGKLLHIHFHGRSMAVADDFAEIGLDCVCPFERGPGGDVNTPSDLARVRKALGGRVTFNGNVHTVNTLIFGSPGEARREVAELKEAFARGGITMTGRERIAAALAFEEPDRPPCFEQMFELTQEAFGLSFPSPEELGAAAGILRETLFARCAEIYKRTVETFGWDAVLVWRPAINTPVDDPAHPQYDFIPYLESVHNVDTLWTRTVGPRLP